MLKAHFDGILGINIGKIKIRLCRNGKDDYLICMENMLMRVISPLIFRFARYTRGLRTLQYGVRWLSLAFKNKQNDLQAIHHMCRWRSKIAPDLCEEELIEVADSLLRHNQLMG